MSEIKHILSVIHYTICGAVCFQFTHFLCDDWENIYTLSYYHQIGSMNYYPLLRVRSWNNGMRCISFYILRVLWNKQYILPREKKIIPSAIRCLKPCARFNVVLKSGEWVSTHWCRDKTAAISQTTLSIAFSWMKMLELRLNFHWSLFLRVQLTIFQHWFT